jgi:zinc transporter ZupT
VLTHDFSDGINTVTFILKNGGTPRRAFVWLTLDALTPVLGAASTLLFRVPQSDMGAVLAIFAGCFFILVRQILYPRANTVIRVL